MMEEEGERKEICFSFLENSITWGGGREKRRNSGMNNSNENWREERKDYIMELGKFIFFFALIIFSILKKVDLIGGSIDYITKTLF